MDTKCPKCGSKDFTEAADKDHCLCNVCKFYWSKAMEDALDDWKT
jgi:hypothetical protein